MSNWPSNYIDVNGIKLHYHRTGGDKPPLILLHGITDSGLCWLRTGLALEADYDLIMVDARGHGLSGKPDTGYTYTEHADDVAGLVQALGLKNPAVMGHSMGAGTAANFGANYPDLAGCLILEDPPWRPDDETVTSEERLNRANEWRTTIEARQRLSPAEIKAEGRETNPLWDEIEFGPWSEAKTRVSPNVTQLVTTLRTWQDVVPQISCPTLLITGDPDVGALVTPDTARDVAEENSHIQVAHIPDAGHNIRRDQFTAFITAVTRFLMKN